VVRRVRSRDPESGVRCIRRGSRPPGRVRSESVQGFRRRDRCVRGAARERLRAGRGSAMFRVA